MYPNNKYENIVNYLMAILYDENCIDKNTYDIINNKIEKDDKRIISAFELYAITKDHSEFIEALILFLV